MNVRRALLLLFALFCLGAAIMASQRVEAHGGVMIQTDTLENYEYLVQIYPYPPQVGVNVISLLMFDFAANRPANDFTGEVFLAPPGSAEPCCKPGVHRGPFPLYSDPVMYPGDNTAYLPIDVAGEWQVQFRIHSEKQAFQVVVPLSVQPLTDGQTVDPPAIATQAAVMALVAQSMQTNSAVPSPLSTPGPASSSSSPLSAPLLSPLSRSQSGTPAGFGGATAATALVLPSRFNPAVWWGMAAVIVVGMIFSVWRVGSRE